MAIKVLEKSRIIDVADVERVSREIHILKLIRHPNIIQLYEIIETPKQLFLVMEYVSDGELFDYIVKKKKYLITHSELRSRRPASSCTRYWPASSISISSVSCIETSNHKICSSTLIAELS